MAQKIIRYNKYQTGKDKKYHKGAILETSLRICSTSPEPSRFKTATVALRTYVFFPMPKLRMNAVNTT